jgi:hypothetical protein
MDDGMEELMMRKVEEQGNVPERLVREYLGFITEVNLFLESE